MLRTNTLALCGYSGADPILHATFREVYEERAAVLMRRDLGSVAGGEPEPRDAQRESKKESPKNKTPVFFFGLAGRREFHSLEILRAATAAVGLPTGKLLDHPNLIEFEASGFPTIDDHFRLIAHRVLRKLQSDALRTRLRRVAPLLLGHPCPDADYQMLLSRFENVCREEEADLAAAGDESGRSAADRRQLFEGVVDWTWYFAAGLLRELALAEFVEGRQGPSRVLRTHRRFPWYQAAAERLDWTAWGVIVELALREMVRTLPGARNSPPQEQSRISAEESSCAAVSFTSAGTRHQPGALCIRLGGFDRPGDRPRLSGAFHHVAYWEFNERDVPWPRRPVGLCPTPRLLWNYAVGRRANRKQAARYLGLVK